MGTNMHNPFIEIEGGSGKEGRGAYDLVACLADRSFSRDYLLFDILGGARHGMQHYSITPKVVDDSMSEELFRHTHRFIRDADKYSEAYRLLHGYDERPWSEAIKDKDLLGFEVKPNTWYKEHEINPASGHGWPSWITLDEAKEVQNIYIQQGRMLRTSPEAEDERAKIEEHRAKRERGENPGMLAVRGTSLIPVYHAGMDQAILMMTWAEEEYKRPTRMCFCFTY